MIYLKKFENHKQYEDYVASGFLHNFSVVHIPK